MTLDNNKAHELFNAAKKLLSAERELFLDKECGEDDALRVEVEALLKHHDFTSANTEGSGDSGGLTVDYEPGDMIGKFKIIGVLGEGGMGIVYLAEQSKPVKRRVALKVIKAGMDTKQVIARFEAERQALAMMNHPGIAQVYEAGATEEGRPYFALEFVKGMPITDACDEHKRNTKQRLELLAKVCDAVQHAHTKGIIHRDLKPSNILVSLAENDVLEPKIIDFGVAKATNQQLTDKTLVTEVGRFIGTPAYMSPEQADLKATDIDTRTDVYALGVVTYEVLTGFPPFDPKTLHDAGRKKMREIIRTQPPPKPSTKLSSLEADDATEIAQARQTQIAALAGLLRKELEWIPLKALKKLRSERYDSAKSMGDDIRRYLAGEPLKAGPDSSLYTFKKALRKHKGPFIAAAIVLLVLIGGIIATRTQATRANKALEDLEAANVVAEQERASALAKDKIIESQAVESAAKDVRLEAFERAYELSDKGKAPHDTDTPELLTAGRDVLANDPNGDQDLVILAGQDLAPILHEFGKYRRFSPGNPDDLIRLVLDYLPHSEVKAYIIEIIYALYDAYAKLDKEEQQIVLAAVESLNESFGAEDAGSLITSISQVMLLKESTQGKAREDLQRLFDQILATNFETLAEIFVAKIEFATLSTGSTDFILGLLGSFDYHALAESVGQDWIEANRGSQEWKSEAAMDLGKKLGRSLSEQKKHGEAVSVFREWLEISKESRGIDNEETIWLGDWLGSSLYKQAKYTEAEEVFSEWLEISKESLGVKSESAMDLGSWLGKSLYYQKKYSEAETVFQEWLEISKESRGIDNQETIWMADWLGDTFRIQKNYNDADAVYREWIEISKESLGEKSESAMDLGNSLGKSLYYQKNYCEAESVFQEWLEISKESRGEDNLETIRLADWLGATFDRQKKYSEAEAVYREWLEISKETFGEKSDVALDLGRDLGMSIYEQKNYTEAEPVFREWIEISKESRGKDNVETISLGDWLGGSLYSQEKYSEAEAVYREWLEISKVSLGAKSKKAIEFGKMLGRSLSEQKKYSEAEAVFREWLEISKESLGAKSEIAMDLGRNLGISIYDQKNYTDAETVFQEWLEISKESRGEDNLKTIWLGHWLGNSLNKQKKYSEAETLLQEWLEISKNALGEGHATTIDLAAKLIRNLSNQKRYGEAEAASRKWLEISKKALGEEHLSTAFLASWLGYTLRLQENYEEAERVFRQWLDVSRKSFGEEHYLTIDLSSAIGWALNGQKKYSEAEKILVPCYKISNSEDFSEYYKTTSAWWLGEALFWQGKYALAEEPLIYSFNNSSDIRIGGESIQPKVARLLVKLYVAIDKPEEAQKYRDFLLEKNEKDNQ